MASPFQGELDKIKTICKYSNDGNRRMDHLAGTTMRPAHIRTRAGLVACAPVRQRVVGSSVKGGCKIKPASSTQTMFALSLAEADVRAATRAFGEAKGLKPIGEEFGESLQIRTHVDAQATIALSHPALDLRRVGEARARGV